MPDISIDPSFSVYALIERTETERLLLNHRPTMLIASSTIEDSIILDRARSRIFLGVQRMSQFLPHVDRYRWLARNAESVYVFGIMDAELPVIDKVEYVALKETDQLAKEWFLVADSQEFYSLLAGEEISEQGATGDQRTYWGLWVYDDTLVTTVQEPLTALVGAAPLPHVPARRDYRRQLQLMSSAMFRLSQQLTLLMTQPTPESGIVAREVKLMLEQYIAPGVQSASSKLRG